MKLNLKNKDYNKKGVYRIVNMVNGKVYIGSTTQSFIIRFGQHLYELENNKHKNKHLQHSYNKYGKNQFRFEMIKVCKDVLEEEQKTINSFDFERLYNINPNATGTPNLCEETIKKRALSFGKTNREAMVFYYKVKNKDVSLNDVPLKYKKLVKAKLNNIPWNKGKTSKEVDYSYLKGVKKNTNTEAYRKGREAFKKKMRNLPLGVYDIDDNLLYSFSSIVECCEYLNNTDDNVPFILRNKKGRNGYPATYVSQQNVSNVLNGRANSYKGLKFKRHK